MKSVWMTGVLVVGLGVALNVSGSAQAACCASGAKAPKTEAKAKKSAAQCKDDVWSCEKLNLSEEQKTQLKELKASCATKEPSEATREEMTKQLKSILTEEQFALFSAHRTDAACATTKCEK